MRILLAISILVLMALLWATVSIIRHIRKAHRRSRFLRERQSPNYEAPAELQSLPENKPNTPEPTFAELSRLALAAIPSAPRREALPIPTKSAPSAGVSSAHRATVSQNPSAGALGLIAAARQISQEMSPPPTRKSDIRKAVEISSPELPATLIPPAAPQSEVFAPLAIVEVPFVPSQKFQPAPQPTEASQSTSRFPKPFQSRPHASKAPSAPTTPNDPFIRRPVRSVHPQPTPGFVLPSHRPDWIYFNKDMGDLSDPLPGRIRDRVRSR